MKIKKLGIIGSLFLFLCVILGWGVGDAGAGVKVTFKTYKDKALTIPKSVFSPDIPDNFFWASVEVDRIDSPLVYVHLNAIEFTRVYGPDDVPVLQAVEGYKGPMMIAPNTFAETYIDNIPTWRDTAYVNLQVMEIEGKVGVTGGPGSVAIVKFQVMSGASLTAEIGLTEDPHNPIPTHNSSSYRILFIDIHGNSIPVDSVTPATIEIKSRPEPPADLSAATVSSSQIRLNWKDKSHNEDNFVIERKVVGGIYTEVKIANRNVETWLNDIALSPHTTYCYQIKACNAVGCSVYSNESCTVTRNVLPNCALLGLTATPKSTSRIDLVWNDLDNETGYVIQARTVTTFFSDIATLPSNSTFYPHTGLSPPKTTYFYLIKVSNDIGDCYSNIVEATTCDYKPAAPSRLTFPVVKANQIELKWTDNSNNESGFKIERRTGNDLYSQIATVGDGVTDYIDNDPVLQPKTLYRYRVRACNDNPSSCDDYKCSDYVYADVTTPDAPPKAPNSLTATANSSSQITLVWTDNSNNETGFKIERRKGSATGPIEKIIDVPSTTREQINILVQFIDTGLSRKTTYYYQVLAYNGIGNSGYSNPAFAATFDTSPVSPENLQAAAVSDSRINLSWLDKSNNEDGFIIERGSSETGPFSKVDKVDTGTITYSHTGLASKSTHWYRVKAWNGIGDSGYSNVAGATTNDTFSAAPSNLNLSDTGITQFRLNWTDNAANETGFRIERKTTGGYVQIAEIPVSNTITYLNTGLPPTTTGTTYTYRVRAYNSVGNSGYSNEASGTTLPSHFSLAVNSTYGSPVPPVGSGAHASGASVTASVISLVSGPSGTRYVCTGWTGTGSVPPIGTTTTVTFNITKNSTITWQWRVEYQLLTAVNNPDCGEITPVSGGWYEADTSVVIKAISKPGPGCDFVSWSGNLSGLTDNPAVLSMDGPKSVVAYFGVIQCALTVNSAYGSPSPGAGIHFYSCNTPLTLSCPSSPVNGASGVRYVLTGWTRTGSVPASGTVSGCPVRFTLTQNSTITWNWKTEYYLTTSVEPAGGGSVTPSSGWYNSGDSVTITAAPESSFSGWTGAISGTTNPASLIMDGPWSVTAKFGCPTCHEADNNPCDCVIDDGELLLYINRWVAAKVTDESLLIAINIWVAGSCNNWKPGSCLSPSPAPVFSPPVFKGPERAPAFNGDRSNGPQSAPSNSQVTVTRTVNCSGDPTIEVTLTVDVDESNKPSGIIIKEYIPSNWTIISSTPNYVGNPATGEIKWLLSDFSGNVNDQVITYQVQILGGDKTFRGKVVYTDPDENLITKDIDGDVRCGGDDGYIQCKDTFQVTVTRTMDCSADPTIKVTLAVNVDELNKPAGIIIKEYIPSTWSVISSTPNYVGNPARGEIKWLLSDFTGNVNDQTITYQVQISGGDKTFRGEVVYTDPSQNVITIDICGYTSCNSRALTVISTYGSPSPDSGTYSYPVRTSVTASVTSPVSGPAGSRYVCTGWNGTGSVPGSGSGTSFTFTITEDSTLTWNWQTEYYLTTMVNPAGGGSITVEPSSPDNWYDQDQSLTLRAVPNTAAGYVFSGWSGNLSGMTNPTSLTMSSPKSVTAQFVSGNQPPVAKAGSDQTDIGIGKTVVLDGSLSSDPDDDPISYQWTQIGGPTVVLSNPTVPKPTFTPLTIGEYRFQLVVNDGQQNSAPDEVIITVKYTLTVVSAYGVPSPSAGIHYYDPGIPITVLVTSPFSGGSGIRHVCNNWSGTGSVLASGIGTTTTFTINENSTITWNWKTEYQLTASVNPPGEGTISISPVSDGNWYKQGHLVTVVASPSDAFNSWSGDPAVNGRTDPRINNLLMDGPKTITANFGDLVIVKINAPAEVDYGTTFTATADINQVISLKHGWIYLSFDSKLFELRSLDAGSLTTGAAIWQSSLPGAWVIFDMGGAAEVSRPGSLLKAEFKVIGGQRCDKGEIGISAISLGDANEQEIEVDSVMGTHVTIGIGCTGGLIPPTNLTLEVISANKIDLKWWDNSNNEDGFRIERKEGSGRYNWLKNVDKGVTSYSDSNLLPEETTYCYRVRAYNNQGDSDWSNEVCTSKTIPLPPDNLRAKAVSVARIDLTWNDNSTNEWGFKIERSLTGGGAGFSVIGEVGGNVTVYHDKGLNSKTTYFYRVKAWNNQGNSPYSNEVSATTPVETVLKVTAPETVAPLATFEAMVEVTPVNKLSLVIFRMSFDPSVFCLISTEAGDLISSTNPTISSNNSPGKSSLLINIPGGGVSGSGGLVKFTFEAIGVGGDSSRIELDRITLTDVAGKNIPVDSVLPAQVTIVGCFLAPPANLRTTASGQNSVILSWQDISLNETGFKIERSVSGGSYLERGNVLANTTGYTDTGLSPCTSYSYRVKAYNEECESGYAVVTFGHGAPKPPSGLAGVRISSAQIDLSWQDTVDESGYRIERRVNGGSFTQIGERGANVPSYSDGGLDPNTTYCYRVRACNNECGCSVYSQEVCIPPCISPPLPYNLQATAVSETETETEIGLTWQSASGDKIGFIIERRKLNEIAFTELTRGVPANVTTYTDSNLECLTKYCYRVKAYNSCGVVSGPSGESCATTITCGELKAPDSLSATAVSSIQIRLNWRDNSTDEDGFKIERGLDGTNFTQIEIASANTTTYLDNGLKSGTTYYYRVRAYEGTRHSEYSNKASATPGLVPPGNLRGQNVQSNQVTIAWRDNSDNEKTGFKIERSIGCTGLFSQIDTVAAGVITYQNTGLTAGTSYCYRVRAYNQWGDSAYSNTLSLETPPTPPEAPSNLTAEAVSSSRIDLSWQNNSLDEDGFKIERHIGLGGNWIQIDRVPANIQRYHDVDVSPLTTYYYRVRACNDEGGDSGYSNTVEIHTPPGLQIFPVKLVFASDRTGNYEVYLMDDDGGAVTRLTDDSGRDWQPVLSPGRVTRVAFVSDREGNSDIYLMGAGGANLIRLTDDPAEDVEPFFSSDGTQIVFSSNRDGDNYYDIYLLDVNDTGSPVQLTQNTAGDRSPSFSPDGTRIVFVSDQDGNNEIYTMDMNGNEVSQLTSTNYPVDNSQPCFSPNGLRIAFSSNRSGNDEIYVMDSNGENLENITNDPAANDFDPSFSPSPGDNRIAFTSNRDGNQEIYLINIDPKGQPDNLTNQPARDVHPFFGPALSPFSPSNLSIQTVGVGDGQIKLAWLDRSTNEEEFVIERRIDGLSYSESAKVDPGIITYVDTVETGIDYCYQIRARNEYGSSEPSNEVCFPDCCDGPNPPTGLSAGIVSCSQIKLTWMDNSDNETVFKIERSGNGSNYYTLDMVDANDTTYLGIHAGNDYYYRVRAVNAQRDSNPSNEVQAKVLDPPTNFTGKRLATTQLELAWQDNSECEDGFIIERKTEGGGYTEIDKVGQDVTTYRDSGLNPDETYYYRVRAYNELEKSDFAETPPLEPGSKGLIVYPNPFFYKQHSGITFEGDISAGDKIWIYTLAGELVQTLSINGSLPDKDGDGQKFTWDNPTNENGERLASGIYFYILKSSGGKAGGKFAVVY